MPIVLKTEPAQLITLSCGHRMSHWPADLKEGDETSCFMCDNQKAKDTPYPHELSKRNR
jgi:hypothetical protein